jgi:hypothetical protein
MKGGRKRLCIAILIVSSMLPFTVASASQSYFIDDIFGGFDRQEYVEKSANYYDGASAMTGCFVSNSQIELVKGVRHWKPNC